MPARTKTQIANQYDDKTLDYRDYWQGRDYEQQSEVVAIKRLLNGRHFANAVDVGGGYGRLCLLLAEYADTVTLVEPSQKQLELAKDFLKSHPEIKKLHMSNGTKLDFKDGAVDLVTMVRVMHHLPDPIPELKEISRILTESGYAVIEVANYGHALNRLKHIIQGKKLPTNPVDIRSPEHRTADFIPFVDHNPKTVIGQLNQVGLEVVDTLSVSNLRSGTLKKVMPQTLMVEIEKNTQHVLAPLYFGPSIFFLVRKLS